MAGRVPASLLGAVTRWDRTADEPKGEESHPSLVGIPVSLRAENGQLWHSTSDSEGIVTFEALPAGSYSIIPIFPQTLTFDRGQNLGHDYSKVTIPASSPAKPAFCRASLEGVPSSGIEGRVLTSGHALRDAVVTAWLIRNGRDRDISDGFPENGNFRLPHLPAGTYRITFSEDSGKRKLPGYTQIVEVREARITRVVLARK